MFQRIITIVVGLLLFGTMATAQTVKGTVKDPNGDPVPGAYVIPDGVKWIGASAFMFCRNLTSIVIPSSVKSIENAAFSGCSNLTSLVISDGVTNIGNHAFYRCTSLTSVTIPDSLTSIGEGVFAYCDKLIINYTGKTNQWKNLIGNNNRVFENTTYKCNCINGVVRKLR